jgi:hypothetical protein
MIFLYFFFIFHLFSTLCTASIFFSTSFTLAVYILDLGLIIDCTTATHGGVAWGDVHVAGDTGERPGLEERVGKNLSVVKEGSIREEGGRSRARRIFSRVESVVGVEVEEGEERGEEEEEESEEE